MNRIIYVVFLVFCLSIFTSCKKCKDCSCSQVITQTGSPDVNQDVEFTDVCDEDLDDIEGRTTVTQNVAGVTQTIEQTCECK